MDLGRPGTVLGIKADRHSPPPPPGLGGVPFDLGRAGGAAVSLVSALTTHTAHVCQTKSF